MMDIREESTTRTSLTCSPLECRNSKQQDGLTRIQSHAASPTTAQQPQSGANPPAMVFSPSRLTSRCLRAKLLPDYPVGCKPVLISDNFFRVFQQGQGHARDDGHWRDHREGRQGLGGRSTRRTHLFVLATRFPTLQFM